MSASSGESTGGDAYRPTSDRYKQFKSSEVREELAPNALLLMNKIRRGVHALTPKGYGRMDFEREWLQALKAMELSRGQKDQDGFISLALIDKFLTHKAGTNPYEPFNRLIMAVDQKSKGEIREITKSSSFKLYSQLEPGSQIVIEASRDFLERANIESSLRDTKKEVQASMEELAGLHTEFAALRQELPGYAEECWRMLDKPDGIYY